MSETVQSESVSPSVKRLMRYGRVPLTVLNDPTISSDAVRVYGILATTTRQGNVSNLGLRFIGEGLGVSAATVMRRIRELVAAGHVTQVPGENGKRAFYVLTSPVFGQKQRSGVESLVSGPRGRLRMATVRIA